MFTISKRFSFSASHALGHLPAGHKCKRLHGHNYTVVLALSGDLDPDSFVLDYGKLAPFKDYLDRIFDHRHICGFLEDDRTVVTVDDPAEVEGFHGDPATAERLAHHFYYIAALMFPGLVRSVGVMETPNTLAEYHP